MAGPPQKRNHLLAALPVDDYKAPIEHATVISLKYGKQLYLQDVTFDRVYFPLTCVVYVLVGVSDGTKVEMPTVGNEGLPVPITASSARNASDCVLMNPQSGSFHPWPAPMCTLSYMTRFLLANCTCKIPNLGLNSS